MRRALGVLALGLLLLAGCGKSGTTQNQPTTPPPTTTTPADPVALLRGAMLKSVATTLHMEGAVTVAGQALNLAADADSMARSATVKLTGLAAMEARIVGQDMYLKVAGLGAKPWIHLDLTKLKATSSLRTATDFSSQLGIMGGVVTAEQTSPGHYKGTADLDKAAAAATADMRKNLEAVASMAKNASEVEFEAAVDDEGHLTALSYTLELGSAAGSTSNKVKTELTLSKFGEPVSVEKPPAADVGEAPASLYAQL